MRIRFRTTYAFVLLIIIALATGTCIAADCVQLHYNQSGVRLEGLVYKRVFAGPPNYRSVQRGDRPETVWVLVLAKPVCMTALPADQENESADNIVEIQILFTEGQHVPDGEDASRQVSVTGRLFSAQSGHHHLPVLMEVEAIRYRSP